MSLQKEQPTIAPLLVSIPEAAKILSTTKWQIRTLLWKDKLPHLKLGKRHLIPVRALEDFVRKEVAEAP